MSTLPRTVVPAAIVALVIVALLAVATLLSARPPASAAGSDLDRANTELVDPAVLIELPTLELED
jgi:hypothetical protein